MAEDLRTRYLLAAAFALTAESAELSSIIGKKLRQGGAPKSVVSRFCEKCGVLVVPGETADFRVKKGKVLKDCLCCPSFR